MNECLLTFDVEDWFQVENLRPLFPPSDWDAIPRRIVASTRTILDLLAEYDIQATFFILGWIADREPALVREIAARGHEVACHGYGHVMPMLMKPGDFRADVQRARKTLQDLSGQPVIGYRAPSFSIDHERLSILAELGFTYDSSHHPFRLHNRYGRLGSVGTCVTPGVYRTKDGLLELSLPVEKLGPLSVPVAGGAFFRLYPGAIYRALAKRSLRRQGHFAMYLHSWEFDPGQPRVSRLGLFRSLRHYTNLNRTGPRLRRVIELLGDQGTAFAPAERFLRARSLLPPNPSQDQVNNTRCTPL